jgi:hypothetical protein
MLLQRTAISAQAALGVMDILQKLPASSYQLDYLHNKCNNANALSSESESSQLSQMRMRLSQSELLRTSTGMDFGAYSNA